MEVLFGLHPVIEAIRSGSREFDHICVARERQDKRLEEVVEACKAAGIRVRLEPREHLAKLARTPSHQGVVAIVRNRAFLAMEDLLPTNDPANTLLLALDGVEDPQNLGALLRVADGAGVMVL